ncbi:MAG: DUF4386 family protein [Anaerolineae bacterium]|nr:DUF4386 family protein [Anaerolineae bacterium]
MSQAKPAQAINTKSTDSHWRALYRAGGIAPLVTLAFYLTEVFAIILGDMSGEPFPSTVNDWFSLLQRSRLLGILYLNALDVFSIALLGVMFLALYIALKQYNESYMAIAAFFSFLGVGIFVATRADMGAAMLTLSDKYAAATTDAQMAQLLAAGEAVSSLVRATPETIGWFLMAIGGLIISLVMLNSETFNKPTAYVGILSGVVTFAVRIVQFIAPSIAGAAVFPSAFPWLLWWLLVSWGLFRLGRDALAQQ